MTYLFYGLTFLILLIAAIGIIAVVREPKEPVKNKVRLMKFLPIAGVVCSVFFVFLACVFASSDEPLWGSFAFLGFSILGVILIIAFINCRITYDEDGFTSQNFFRIKRRYTYDEVTAMKENLHEKYLYMGNRKVMIDDCSVGNVKFILFVRYKYTTIHGGLPLPKILPNTKDLFHGNIHNPGEFIFVYALMGIIILVLCVFTVKSVYFSPYTAENTVEQQVTFRSFKADGEDFVMYSTSGELYKIQFTDEQVESASIQAVCDRKTEFTVYSKKFTPSDMPEFYSVKAIYHGDTALFTFEEANRLNIREYAPIPWITIGIAFAWAAYIALSIKVGRNPKKYGKKIVRLFFKDSYVKY